MMLAHSTPLLSRIAARRSAPQQQWSRTPMAEDPQSEAPTREPFVPEWRRRAAERVQRSGYVAVVDTTEVP